MTTTRFDAGTEFDRQVRSLVHRGYPALADLAPDTFMRLVAPLREIAISRSHTMKAPTEDRVPFVVVTGKGLVPAHQSVALTELGGRPGFVDYEPEDIARFEPIHGLAVPPGLCYLVFDVDRGDETLNATPDDAVAAIGALGRTPITVDEGIAFITHFPGSLAPNHCFHMAASRCGDRRVPALWISERAPKLGWCWAGNHHTWLGTASCSGRAGDGES